MKRLTMLESIRTRTAREVLQFIAYDVYEN